MKVQAEVIIGRPACVSTRAVLSNLTSARKPRRGLNFDQADPGAPSKPLRIAV